MSYENVTETYSGPAAVDLSTYQFKFVIIGAAGIVTITAGAAAKCLGVLQNAPALGDTAVVAIAGRTKIRAGAGGLALNDYVTNEHIGAADTGKGIATTTIRQPVRGICVKTATAEDDLGVIRLVDFCIPDAHA
jgi:hypothetical protein